MSLVLPHDGSVEYIAFDPGLWNAWAAFNAEGYPFATGVIRDTHGIKNANLHNLIDFLASLKGNKKPKKIICEDFILEQSNKIFGQRVIASEAIGVIRTYCKLAGIPIIMSPRTNLRQGCERAGIKYPFEGSHDKSHVPSAIAHGTYYAIYTAKIRSVLPAGSDLKLIDPL